jgi:glycosyltransferase involved in cell wall biosynthesis
MKYNLPSSLAFIAADAFSLVNFRGRLIADLSARGVMVYAIAPNFSDAIRLKVRELGAVPVDCSLDRTGMNPIRDLSDCIGLSRLLRKLQPQATFCYAIKPVIYGTLAALFARVPLRFAMVEGLGFLFMEDEAAQSFKRRFLRNVARLLYGITLKRNNAVILLNADDEKDLMRMGLIDPQRTKRIPGIGVDLSFFYEAPSVRVPATFVLVARMLREKGVYDFAEAARILKKAHPEARFLLVGGTDANPGSVSEAELLAWHNEGVIEWMGQVDDVRPYIQQASVFVLPSYYREGLPRSTQEAMAMGRPVITTDSPGCRDTVVDGQNGMLVPVRSPGKLVDAMAHFIQSPDLIESMGKKSRELAEQNYDVDNINRKILSIMSI